MKKIINLIVGVFLLTSLNLMGQRVSKDYFDGELYMKIKDATPYSFDTSTARVDLNEKLTFLKPLADKYKITKTDASFYFSKSEILKRTFRIYFDRSEMVEQFIADLERLEQVDYAEKVPVNYTDYTPNDLGANTILGGQYSLYNIHAQEAWDVVRGFPATWIAVVDVAVDITHSDLSGNVILSRDVSDSDNDPNPPPGFTNTDWEHGTHCSGIACARTDNNNGIASIGFGCRLVAIKATPNTAVPDINNRIPIIHGYEGIAWAVSNGAQVISCSWGSNSGCGTCLATINDAYNNNAIVVAAAGNNNNDTIQYPAGYTHVLSVASVNINDQKAGSSTFGSWVKVAAPGVSIRSTIPGNAYASKSGTSMAAPLVAGLCGLVRSLNASLSYDDVVNCVISNADNIDAQNPGFIGLLGSGRINAFKSVECALPCNGSLYLTGPNFTTPKTESSATITSVNGILPGAHVIFDAAVAVIMQPGFIANDGCTFHAYIDGCGGSRLSGSNGQNPGFNNNIERKEIVIETNTARKIKVYPNPFSNKFTVEFEFIKNDDASIKLFDLMGKQIKTISKSFFTEGKHDMTVDASDLPAGIYFLVLQSSDFRKEQKIVKVN